jgi:subtilisin-like proprotein convertase family protein/PKD repeat protein
MNQRLLKLFTVLVMALCAYTTQAQTVVYSQDFEGTAPWGMTRTVGTGTNLWDANDALAFINGLVVDNLTGGPGKAAMASSDATCDGSLWDAFLTSPAIDLTNATTASVSFKSKFQQTFGLSGGEFAVSTDGINYTPLYTTFVDDPAGSAFAVGNLVLTYDLTPYVGGNVFLRWNYVELDGCDWYWQIDDVSVTATLPPPVFQTACNLGTAIVDNSCVATATIPVSTIGVLGTSFTLESAEIIIDHTWSGDLDISLTSPAGTVINLSDDNGGGGDDYGDPNSTCTLTTKFIAGAPPITGGTAPFIGSFAPEGNIAIFNTNAENANGNWILTVCDDATGDVGTINFFKLNFVATPPPPPAITDSFFITCPSAIAIPDNGCLANNFVETIIPASGLFPATGTTAGTHTFNSVDVILDHTWDSDLEVFLISPTGTTVELTSDNGGSGDDYGNVANCNQPTRFIMSATTPITAGTAPFIGQFIPEGDLDDFNNGQDPNGIWKLRVCDNALSDVGVIVYAKINFVENAPTYCAPVADADCAGSLFGPLYVAGVELNTINNPSGCAGYTDFTNLSTQVSLGLPYTINVDKGFVAAFPDDQVTVWIDYNIDGDFDDVGELVFQQTGAQATYTGTVNIPLTASAGTTRMRVLQSATSLDVASPCGPISLGEYEDYSIEILGAPLCLPPTTLTASNITTTQAQLNWNAVVGALSYDVEYREVGQPTWIFVGNFLDPTTSAIVNGLTPQTAYEFQVQARCSLTDTSGFFATGTFSTSCFDCPLGGVAEAENCGDDSNGGCNTDPITPPYETIAVNTPVCGTAWADGNLRDTDWFQFTITNSATVTLSIQSDFPPLLGFLDPATVCNSGTFLSSVFLPGAVCADTSVSFTLCAGTYGAFVAVADFNGFPCGVSNNYTLTVTEAPVSGGPANDAVCDAIELPVGVSCTSQTYDNTGAIFCPSDINPGCTFGGPDNFQSQDIWFYLVVPASGEATVTTAPGTLNDGLMAAYTGDCNNLTLLDCNDDFVGLMPQLNLQGLTPGDTIWIQMAGWQGGTGTFEICAFDCDVVPGPGTPENEACFTDINGGCNQVPVTFQPLTCNETIVGTSFYDGFTRDTDWFTYTVTATTSVSWTVQADFVPAVFILDANNCGNIQLLAQGPLGNPCDVITAQAVLGPGTYQFFVGPDFSSPLFDCTGNSGDYIATLNVSTPDPTIAAQANACIADAPFTITAVNPGGTFTSNGAGITDPLNGVFDPAAAGIGSWEIYYTILSNGCTVADTIVINVQDVPTAAIVPTGADSLCFNPANETYTIPSIPGADSYNWILTPSGAGTVTGTDTSVVVDFEDTYSGVLSLVVAGVNECGTGAFSSSFDIVITPLPGQAGTPAGPNSLCSPAPTSVYTTAGDGTSTSYAWTIVTTPASSTSISGTGTTGTVTWDANFSGTASITVTGSNSCGVGTASAAYSVTVNASTPSVIDPVTTPICANGGSVQLTATPTGGVFSGDDVTSGGLFTPTNGAGVYTILYTPVGGCSSPSTLTLNVGDVPAAPSTPLGISSQCQDGPNTTVFVVPVNGATSYTWSVTPQPDAGTVTDNGGNVVVVWDASFFGEASFIVSATNGCGTSLFSQPLIITINPNPIALITPSGPYCVSDQSFQLNANQTGFWSSTCNNVTSSGLLTPTAPGTCDVSVTVVENGCQGTGTSQIVINPAVNPDIITPSAICSNDAAVTLVGSPNGGTWSANAPNGLFDPTSGSQNVTYTLSGQNGCSGTVTELIDVNNAPVAQFSYSAQCQALTFYSESTDGAAFFWNFGDGNGTSTAENTSYIYNTDGTINVTLTVTNSCGTSDTTVTIVVVKCLSVDENIVDNLSVYPNPTNGLVNVIF